MVAAALSMLCRLLVWCSTAPIPLDACATWLCVNPCTAGTPASLLPVTPATYPQQSPPFYLPAPPPQAAGDQLVRRSAQAGRLSGGVQPGW